MSALWGYWGSWPTTFRALLWLCLQTSVWKKKCSSWKETNFSLIKKKKVLGVLGNCVLKKWSYISADTPVTLACQEYGCCGKATHRRRTSVGAKGEKLYPLRRIYSQREVVFGLSVWHQRTRRFYPVELLFLVSVVGRSFLFWRGREEVGIFHNSWPGLAAAAGWKESR